MYVGHEFKRRRARQLCALGRGWILEVEHIVSACLDRVDDIQLSKSSLRRVRDTRVIEDSTQVIPRGGVVRRKCDPFLDEALTGIRGQSHGGNIIVSVPTRQTPN
jgi:hypothetical protein